MIELWIFVIGCGVFSWLVWCVANGLSNRRRRVKQAREEDVSKVLKKKVKRINKAWWLDKDEKAAALRQIIDKEKSRWL